MKALGPCFDGGVEQELDPPRFRVLGPLDVQANGVQVPLGGATQRAVLATLLLDANAVVSADRLIGEVWGADAPPSARHTLEVYISRLRRLLASTGGEARIETRPPGYALCIPPAALDLERFDALVAAARQAQTEGDLERASEVLREALALWRGPALADVRFRSGGPSESDRLDELRVVAVEERVGIEMTLGRHVPLINELAALVRQHPARERMREQLMLALYRAGRQADALAVYHEGRRELRDELGLEQGRNLRELAGQIIRQDPSLDLAVAPQSGAPAVQAGRSSTRGEPARRRARFGVFTLGVLLGTAVAAAAVISAATDGSSGRTAAVAAVGGGAFRVALVLPGGAGDVDDFPLNPKINEGLQQAAREHGFAPRVFDSGLDLESFTSTLEKVARDRFDLVIAFGVGMEEVTAPVAKRHPATRFVVLDTPSDETPLEGIENVTGVVFAEHEAAYLAGYLAGLLELEAGARLNEQHVVSLVGGFPTPSVERYMAGFSAGIERAQPKIAILHDFAMTWDAQERCAALANEHVSAGADIIFPVAGACGFGALEASLLHGVWGIGVDGDLSYLGPHILVSVVKRLDRATLLAVKWFKEGRLPRGETVRFDLRTNGVGIAGIHPSVPASIRAKVADAATEIRAGSLVVPSG